MGNKKNQNFNVLTLTKESIPVNDDLLNDLQELLSDTEEYPW